MMMDKFVNTNKVILSYIFVTEESQWSFDQ